MKDASSRGLGAPESRLSADWGLKCRLMSKRQLGQQTDFPNQGFAQCAWNLWWQGRMQMTWSLRNCSWQMVHCEPEPPTRHLRSFLRSAGERRSGSSEVK